MAPNLAPELRDVKRFSIFIAILMTLFMFQSIWNVAAAFCGHEDRLELNQPQLNHFGHHQSELCPQDQSAAEHSHLFATDCQPADQASDGFIDDHHDHLPSFSHFIVVDAFQSQSRASAVAYVDVSQILWENLYQSPHLNLPHPPPELFPLLAG